MRVVTDPAIDLVVLVFHEAILPHFNFSPSNGVQSVSGWRRAFTWFSASSQRALSQFGKKSSRPSGTWFRYAETICRSADMSLTSPGAHSTGPLEIITSVINATSDCASIFVGPSGSRQLRETCRKGICGSLNQLNGLRFRLLGTWEDVARGSKPRDKTLLATLGYGVVTTTIMLLIESLGPNIGENTRAVRTFFRQQLVVLKVHRINPFGLCLVNPSCL